MNSTIISQVLMIIAILSTGVVYGTDMFHALVVRKATLLSKDSSIADLIGHTHFIADRRMPLIGITSALATAICVVLNFKSAYTAGFLSTALLMLLSHLYLYMTIAKPVNTEMAAAAVKNTVPPNIREMQVRWESVINYRAAFLTAAMLLLTVAAVFYGN